MHGIAKHKNVSVILSPCGLCLSQSSVLNCYKCEETNQTNKKVCEWARECVWESHCEWV